VSDQHGKPRAAPNHPRQKILEALESSGYALSVFPEVLESLAGEK
jgi:hypothetical protein